VGFNTFIIVAQDARRISVTSFIQTPPVESVETWQSFSSFHSWFLQEKYLRKSRARQGTYDWSFTWIDPPCQTAAAA